jgi:Flp pilus assembly protein TadD
MRAFLSHSSVDKEVVIAVYKGLEKDSTWLDRAEIEWGDLFLERIAEGIASATDFVLFWSTNASKSEWVRLEVNMMFIQALRSKAIRLRVVVLDATPLPLYLKPFHVFSVIGSPSPAADILQKLLPLLREPVRSARSRFVDRHDEIGRVEAAVDDPEFRTVWAFGFTGVGKSSLVEEALKRTFEGVETMRVDVTPGTGFVELALELRALTRHEPLPVGLDQSQLEGDIRLSIEVLAREERLLLLSNVQHWLDEDGEPAALLLFVLAVSRELNAFEKRPLFLTSTRRPSLVGAAPENLFLIHVAGLKDDHIATLVRNWHFAIWGRELGVDDARQIAPKLYGHPVAARLVAGLLGDHSVTFLEKYPQEIVSLRRDLARILLQDLNLSERAERLMEMLALAGTALPASVIVAAGSFSDEDFQQAVAQCAAAGLINADMAIETHPLFREFFWHRLHRSNYADTATKLGDAVKAHLETLDKTSWEFADLLLVAFRSYALAGNIGGAREMRADLSGELEATAITLYNRRNYDLADKYIQHLLDDNPGNWRMRLYRARIRIRQEEWAEANRILEQMLEERSEDVGVIHAMGWAQLRRNNWPKAMELFTRVIAKREHVASLRDAAECLHREGRNEEALKFLHRAKKQESENPFVLDLESRILEDLGQLAPAYDSALLAAARDPMNAHMQNRLGVIRVKQGTPELAIVHFQKAIELDQDLFSPGNSLASAYIEVGNLTAAEQLLPDLQTKARTPSDSSLLRHTEARIALSKKELDRSRDILKREVTQFHNVVPNLGLLARVQCALFDRDLREFPSIAAVALKEAEAALARIVALDSGNEFIEALRSQIEARQGLTGRRSVRTKTTGSKTVPVAPSQAVLASSPSPSPASSRIPGLPKGVSPPAPTHEPPPSKLNQPSGGPKKKPPLKPPLSPPLKPPFKR